MVFLLFVLRGRDSHVAIVILHAVEKACMEEHRKVACEMDEQAAAHQICPNNLCLFRISHVELQPVASLSRA